MLSLSSPGLPDSFSERYRLHRELGRGSCGVVFLGEHVLLGKQVVVKVLFEHLATDPRVLERFKREACAAARLTSSHVVSVIDYDFGSGGVPFIVMEYLPGRDLKTLLEEEGPLAPIRAVGIALEICAGLEVAHDAGIVHRDLKPANLLVLDGTTGEHVRILDFGIAKLRDDAHLTLTDPGALVGTVAYMSPEQGRGDKRVDHTSDVYSLAAVIYECLAGRAPHQADERHALLYKVVNEPCTPLHDLCPRVPRELCDIVARALRQDVAERTPSVAVLAAELRQFCRNSSGAASVADTVDEITATGDEPALQRAPVRRRWGALHWGALGLASAVAFGAGWYSRPGHESPAASAKELASQVSAGVTTTSTISQPRVETAPNELSNATSTHGAETITASTEQTQSPTRTSSKPKPADVSLLSDVGDTSRQPRKPATERSAPGRNRDGAARAAGERSPLHLHGGNSAATTSTTAPPRAHFDESNPYDDG